MGAGTKQANFLLPDDVLNELKASVSKRERSKVVAEAIRKELKRFKLQKAIQSCFGAWKEADHPELKEGTEKFIRKLRKSSRIKDK